MRTALLWPTGTCGGGERREGGGVARGGEARARLRDERGAAGRARSGAGGGARGVAWGGGAAQGGGDARATRKEQGVGSGMSMAVTWHDAAASRRGSRSTIFWAARLRGRSVVSARTLGKWVVPSGNNGNVQLRSVIFFTPWV